jgi:hypothetical protein
MLTYTQAQSVLADILAGGLGVPLRFRLETLPEKGGFLLSVGAVLPDNIDSMAEPLLVYGGKLYVSNHATHHELVLKAWQAVQAFVLHELREQFFYKGQSIFHPHVDVDALAEHTARTAPAYRAPAAAGPVPVKTGGGKVIAFAHSDESDSTVTLNPVS